MLENSTIAGWPVVIRTSALLLQTQKDDAEQIPAPEKENISVNNDKTHESSNQENSKGEEVNHAREEDWVWEPELKISEDSDYEEKKKPHFNGDRSLNEQPESVFQTVLKAIQNLWTWILRGSIMTKDSREEGGAEGGSGAGGGARGLPPEDIDGEFENDNDETEERISTWSRVSIFVITMIIVAMIFRRSFLDFKITQPHSNDLARLLITATIDHVFSLKSSLDI